MEGEAAFVADRVIAVSERLKVELCETYQLPEAVPLGHWGIGEMGEVLGKVELG